MTLKDLTDTEIFGTRITARSFDIRTPAPGFVIITTQLDNSGVALPAALRDIPVVVPQQTHSLNVGLLFNSKFKIQNSKFPETDALISGLRGVALGVRTADCLPVMVADPESGLIAAVHAGWRGTVGGILRKTVEKMIDMGADPTGVHLYFGPCICADCFEVGADLAEIMERQFSTTADSKSPQTVIRQGTLDPLTGRPHPNSGITASLVEANRRQIADLVPAENIRLSGLCTRHTRSTSHSTPSTQNSIFPFPSWRRDGATASRLLTLILHL